VCKDEGKIGKKRCIAKRLTRARQSYEHMAEAERPAVKGTRME
jgi:hypothetical protein